MNASQPTLLAPGLRRLVDQFVAALDGRVDELRRAVGESDFEQAQLFAHRLKGAGGGYGFPEISEAAAIAEAAIVARSDAATHSVETLCRVCEQAIADWDAACDAS